MELPTTAFFAAHRLNLVLSFIIDIKLGPGLLLKDGALDFFKYFILEWIDCSVGRAPGPQFHRAAKHKNFA